MAMRILLIAYDNDSYIHHFPQGLAYIAAVLKKDGNIVEIYNQDKNHFPDIHLTQYLNKNKFDIVGLGVIAGYYQYKKLIGISKAINKSKNRPFYIIGGHGPTPDPEYFLKKTQADVVVMGEGEETIIELTRSIADNKSLRDVKGIAYRSSQGIEVNERRHLIKSIDSIPFPAYELFPIEYYRLLRAPHAANSDFVMPVLSGRGCTFNCSFCYRMDEGFRPRAPESIIEEIKLLKKEYNINFIVFSDELLMSSSKRTVDLCEKIIQSHLNIKWLCNGRLNYAKKDVLKIMKRAGCVFINYGIEAMDNDVLRNMKKCLTVDSVIKGIEYTLNAGISPGYNIMFGNIGENKETLNKGVEFLLKYDDASQLRTIRPVTPYPGSPLYYYAIEKGMLKDCEDFYEKKHVNSDLLTVNFTEMSDDEFNIALLEVNTKLIKNYFERKSREAIDQSNRLYLEKDVSFRGYRHT